MRWSALAVVVMCGCSADLCARLEQVRDDFEQRHTACIPEDTAGTSFDSDSCRSQTEVCTAHEQALTHRYLDCLESLAPCTPATRSDFETHVLACASPMAEVSASCFATQ